MSNDRSSAFISDYKKPAPLPFTFTLLDLSADFDTLDHSSITNYLLSTWYSIDGIALERFVSDQELYISRKSYRSYLSDRKLMHCFSGPAEVACGVLQGSVPVPLLFTLYTTLL